MFYVTSLSALLSLVFLVKQVYRRNEVLWCLVALRVSHTRTLFTAMNTNSAAFACASFVRVMHVHLRTLFVGLNCKSNERFGTKFSVFWNLLHCRTTVVEHFVENYWQFGDEHPFSPQLQWPRTRI